MRFFSTLVALFALASGVSALISSLQQVTGFTAGPTNASMYVYIPTTKKSIAPIIVAIHGCTGSGPQYFSATQYATYADLYGYIVIYPSSPSYNRCWDVASTASLTHNGGGDSQTIVNMISHAVSNYGGDASRVYVTGTSSGAMMTNVLAGAYPEVFQAGSAYSGVADGCFYVAGSIPGMATPGWNNECSNGSYIQTAQQWGDLVRSYYPGYTGARPKMMLWHGTIDPILYYPNLGEELKQWSNVFGIAFSHNITNTPSLNFTEMVYGDGTRLIGYSAVNVGHTVPVHETVDLAWFCISSPCSGSSTSSSSGSTPTVYYLTSSGAGQKMSATSSSAGSTPTVYYSTSTGAGHKMSSSAEGTIAKWGLYLWALNFGVEVISNFAQFWS